MKVAILGTGSVGQTLARKLKDLGNEVMIGTRNVADSLAKTGADGWGNPQIGKWMQDNSDIELLPFREAVEKGGDIIVFAMNGGAAIQCLEQVGADLLEGKVLMDISNPLDFSAGFPPSLFVSNTDSLGEQIQQAFPTLKVVKTLNTMSNPVMVNPAVLKGDHSVFMSGNDDGAKEQVSEVLQSFGWATHNIIDLGDISTARGTEMVLPIWLRLYGKLQTPYFNFHVNTQAQ